MDKLATATSRLLARADIGGLADWEKVLIRAYLRHIGETDTVVIDEVLSICRSNRAAGKYLVARARLLRFDDRRTCLQCANYQSIRVVETQSLFWVDKHPHLKDKWNPKYSFEFGCSVASKFGRNTAAFTAPDDEIKRRCRFYSPTEEDYDQRNASERWRANTPNE